MKYNYFTIEIHEEDNIRENCINQQNNESYNKNS